MIFTFLRFIKYLPLSILFGRWRNNNRLAAGYTIALPVPMDMPFLLRLALEGLSKMETNNCKQILVIPDGWGTDGGKALQSVIDEFPDKRVELVSLRSIDYVVIRAMRPPGCARTHWMLVVNAVTHAKHDFVFLHDADAFFLTDEAIEVQYREALDRKLDVLGVTARWDEFFTQNSLTISGTWEMLFSTRWALKRSPMALFPCKRSTEHGEHSFDSTLYAQYLDRGENSVGVMKRPPELVHFNGTIFTYRTFRDRGGRQVTDELFRILLLSLLETAIGVPGSKRTTPTVDLLEKGLYDTNAPVLYSSALNRKGYAEFRRMIESMVTSTSFKDECARVVLEGLSSFDRFFEYDASTPVAPALEFGEKREMGLNQ